EVPSVMQPPSGCRFHPRCPRAMAICRERDPALVEVGAGRAVACHLHGGKTMVPIAATVSA
ncbi:MAG TPA: oligopeptide/dipeptide ABC transporter ATP-binding protein, partial [Burkholderiaceae bacterium]|nr:oligopeptide/dipeptide ABC transporter ATP-binding protein [Burkholderiaceae bacterium]